MIDFLGRNISRALPGFTSFTSCDTTAEFMNRGKILCWKAWQECPAVTSASLFMSSPSPSLPRLKRHMMVLQKYTSRLYGEQADPLVSSSVDKVRLDMIIYNGKSWDSIPPSRMLCTSNPCVLLIKLAMCGATCSKRKSLIHHHYHEDGA